VAAAGCANDVLRSLRTNTDQFNQNAAAMVDILWVVDNSESMAQEQQGLGESFQAFIDNLIQSGVDYHIGVVSTDTGDGGRLHSGASSSSYIDPGTANASSAFLQNVKVGTAGARQEKGFESAALVLGKGIGQWTPSNPDPVAVPNTGFLRRGFCDPFNNQTPSQKTCEGTNVPCTADTDCDDAAMFLIFVSDEDDKSFGPVRYYWRLFESYKGPGNEARVKVSAIVGPIAAAGSGDPGGCFNAGRGSAQAGYRYVDLVTQAAGANIAEGIVTSICDDFNEALTNLSITAAGMAAKFELSSVPNIDARVPCDSPEPQAFCVKVDGTEVSPDQRTGYSYEGASNSIVFGVSALPPPQSKITVQYQVLKVLRP